MIYDDVRALLELIDRFVDGDASLAMANEIEGLVLECFSDERWFDDVSLALAQYRPGGGRHYYDEASVVVELKAAASALRDQEHDPCA